MVTPWPPYRGWPQAPRAVLDGTAVGTEFDIRLVIDNQHPYGHGMGPSKNCRHAWAFGVVAMSPPAGRNCDMSYHLPTVRRVSPARASIQTSWDECDRLDDCQRLIPDPPPTCARDRKHSDPVPNPIAALPSRCPRERWRTRAVAPADPHRRTLPPCATSPDQPTTPAGDECVFQRIALQPHQDRPVQPEFGHGSLQFVRAIDPLYTLVIG